MSILLTGAMGFIGQQVRTRLGLQVEPWDSMEPQVHGTKSRRNRAGEMGMGVWDTVIHLAAVVGVGQSMYQPAHYVEANTLDTARFLERLSNLPPKRLVVASSMSVYGEGGCAREDQPPDLRSIYALTKFDQEQLCLMWGRMHSVPTVALRFFNVYGAGQALTNPYTGVLAIFATRLLNGKRPVIFGDGQQSRDFVAVEDVADAVVWAATTELAPGVYNVGTSEAHTIEKVACLLADALGLGISPDITGQERQGDILHCYADMTKTHAAGWKAKVKFEDGIHNYAKWLLTQPVPEDRFEQAKAELVANRLLS